MNFEICEECYLEYFPSYKDMVVIFSFCPCKCDWCGKMKQPVKLVIAGDKVVDLN